MKTVGENIKARRIALGWTQEDLAKRTGYTSKSSINKIELGINDIPQRKIVQFADVLGMSIEEMFSSEPQRKTIISKADALTITIPFVNQKLSAGKGEDYLSDDDIEVKTINISAFMARGIDKATLLAAEVRGDSMVDERIYSGDIVIFSRGLIRQEGIYVINYAGDLMVKKLSFDALNNTVDIISGNRNYPTRTVEADSIAILGKVVGWIHRLDF